MERPLLATVDAYRQLFLDVTYWTPYVAAICARHECIPCSSIRSGLPGTYPVFVVGERYVVKLFGELFNGGTRFPIERTMYELLATDPSIPAPSLLASGNLFLDGEGWPWPYLLMEMLPGTSFGAVEEQVAYEDKNALCRWLGPVMRRIHDLKPQDSSCLHLTWETFERFMVKQRSDCRQRHRTWNTLPEHLVAQIDEYILPNTEMVDHNTSPHVLHCDLNADHVLGSFEGTTWHPNGIIDFGDAMVGDRIYDLVALHMGLFHCDKHLLHTFLQAYGFDDGLQRNFVRRAMTMTLLHEFNVLEEMFHAFPDVKNVATLAELADLIWNLESRGLTGGALATYDQGQNRQAM